MFVGRRRHSVRNSIAAFAFRPSLGGGVAALVVTSLVVTAVVGPSAAAAPAKPTAPAGSSALVPAKIDGASNGADAVDSLGDDLGRVAEESGRTAEELRDLLESDETLWVGPDNELFWAENHVIEPDAGSQQEAVSDSRRSGGSKALVAKDKPLALAGPEAKTPLSTSEVLALHSMPGAEKVIFLDFDGAPNVVQDWTDVGVPATLRGWDPSNDGAAFSADERAMIEQIWATVADRFAPWDVDVTTADPGPAGLARANEGDTTYGAHLIFTSPGSPDIGETFGLNGVATGGFGSVAQGARAYVFARDEWDVRDLADIGAHEVGHTLGLGHHESTLYDDNYSGAMSAFGTPVNNWSPIMGVLGTPLVQWSKGDYEGSKHAQDDLSTIGERLAVRADEAPGDPASAVPLPRSTAYIGVGSDVDAYVLGTCVAGATVNVTPAVEGSSLDVEAALVRLGQATPVATANPPSFHDWWLKLPEMDRTEYAFEGVDAVLTATAGTNYVLQVRGGGNGSWEDGGYDSYGSVGGYTIEVDGCNGAALTPAPAVTVPGAPTALQTAIGGEPLAFSWSKPWNDGGSAITGYRLYRQSYSALTRQVEGSRTQVGSSISPSAFSTSFAAPPTGTYVYHLVAVNAQGESAAATSAPYAYGPAVRVSSAPAMQASSNRVGQTVSVVAPTVVPSGANIAYQWKRSNPDGSSTAIGGATGSTYVLAAADVGRRITVTATATAAGHRPAQSGSLASAPVASAADTGTTSFGGTSTGRFHVAANPDGNLNSGPNDVAVDEAGFVYVPHNGRTDGKWGNDRIQKFTAGGELVATWEVPSPGRLRTTMTSVDVGADGNVYVLDSTNRRVLKYDVDGTLLKRSFVPFVSQVMVLDDQAMVTVDEVGNVYVSDPTSRAIQKLDASGTKVATWTSVGNVRGLRAVTGSGGTTLYYADANAGVVRAIDAATGASLGSWDGASTGGEQFYDPVDVTTDRAGNLYVLEGSGSRVQKFTADFQSVDAFTYGGTAYGVAVGAGGQIYVAVNDSAEEVQLVSHTRYTPDAPTGLEGQAGPGAGEVTASWTAPANSGASGITSYTVTVLLEDDTVAATKTVPGTVTTTTVTGLVGDVRHALTVRATNAAGDSPDTLLEYWLWPTAAEGGITEVIAASGQGLSTATPKVGARVSAVKGTWTPSATVTYQWKIGTKLVSTSSAYTPLPADLGKRLTLTLTGSSDGYAPKAVTVTSKAIAKGTLGQPKKLAVTGTHKVSKTVKVTTTGSWKPAAKLTYQWYANGKAIKSATKASLKLKKAQARKTITVKVTAKATGYVTVVKTLKGKAVKK